MKNRYLEIPSYDYPSWNLYGVGGTRSLEYVYPHGWGIHKLEGSFTLPRYTNHSRVYVYPPTYKCLWGVFIPYDTDIIVITVMPLKTEMGIKMA